MAGRPPPRSSGQALPASELSPRGGGPAGGLRLARARVSRRRDRGEGLRGVGRVPGVHRPGSSASSGIRRRADPPAPRAARPGRGTGSGSWDDAGPAPRRSSTGQGQQAWRPAGAGPLLAGRPATAPARRAAGTAPALVGAAGTAPALVGRPVPHPPVGAAGPHPRRSRPYPGRLYPGHPHPGRLPAGRLSFGAHREDAAWRNHPVLTGAGRVHPRQFAGGLLGRLPRADDRTSAARVPRSAGERSRAFASAVPGRRPPGPGRNRPRLRSRSPGSCRPKNRAPRRGGLNHACRRCPRSQPGRPASAETTGRGSSPSLACPVLAACPGLADRPEPARPAPAHPVAVCPSGRRGSGQARPRRQERAVVEGRIAGHGRTERGDFERGVIKRGRAEAGPGRGRRGVRASAADPGQWPAGPRRGGHVPVAGASGAGASGTWAREVAGARGGVWGARTR